MILKNSRHELFAQAIASGKTPTDAYTLAGFVPNGANGSRLLSVESVRKRVSEIQSAMAARLVKQAYYTREWVVEQLIDNVERAKAAKDYGAANAALRLLGAERSMFITRTETGAPGEFATLTTSDEVLGMVRLELGEDAADALAAAIAKHEAEQPAPAPSAIQRRPGEALN